jgi:glutamyl/glutaminyl-tRNA synthetase
MSVSPIDDVSGTSEVALKWQLVQDQKALAADKAAKASQQVIALSEAKVFADQAQIQAAAGQHVQVDQQKEAVENVQAVKQAQVREQILASQDVRAGQELMVTQIVRAQQDVQQNPKVERGEQVQAIRQSSGASSPETDDSEPPFDLRL